MLYSEVLASVTERDGAWSAAIPPSWSQGRTAFGGLQAALAVRAMRALVPAALPLRTLQVSFIAPVPPGTVRIEARVLRTGKSATQVEARILDAGQAACVALGIFGATRPSAIAIDPPPPQVARSAQQAQQVPFLPGMMPEFVRNVEQRWAEGGFPFSGAAQPRTRIYVRLRHEPFPGPGVEGEAQVIALADAIPSPALSLLSKPAMASSMTWTLELLTERYDAAPDGYWLMDAEVTAGGDGYLGQSAVLWSPGGRAVALSRQSVVVFG
ncbi:MAG: thioesterase family protein [Nevskia sp.]|nr:thioesterase family protein [Nevskia sp.]